LVSVYHSVRLPRSTNNRHVPYHQIAFVCFSEGMVLYGAASYHNEWEMSKVHRWHAILSTTGIAAMITGTCLTRRIPSLVAIRDGSFVDTLCDE
jgi:hypothetical protein